MRNFRSRIDGEEEPVTTWVLETPVFQESGPRLEAAVRELRHTVVAWDDDWWSSGRWPELKGERVVFHGSLANAARIHEQLPWRPGSYCDVGAFHCTAWYEAAQPWLLHEEWRVATAEQLCEDPVAVPQGLAAAEGRVFVRPDSPLKPFSGRVLRAAEIEPAKLDHGFYFDDLSIPVVIAPVRSVTREWRFVVVDQHVVAGREYEASSRAAGGGGLPDEVSALAVQVAASMPPPADVFVLDLCDADGELRLIELNPFGGADLYECDAAAVVEALS
ncbi:MAG: ATP-grasp domain-containing protein [Planctomycetes bacterium]|nr:ATP-grasp domain-containing protein [Planctomycetota bacterium]